MTWIIRLVAGCWCLASLAIFNSHAAAAKAEVGLYTLPATVYSKFAITVSAQVKGKVSEIVEVGDTISKGQLMVALDDRHERRIKQHYQAKVTIVKQQLSLLEAGIKRLQVLSENNSASEQDKELKQLESLNLQQQHHNLQILLAETDYWIARKNIVADVDGVVLSKAVSVGEVVSADTPLLRVLADKPLHVKAQIPLSTLNRVDLSTAVLELTPGQPLPLSLDYVVPQVNVITNTVELSFVLVSPQTDKLLLGQKGLILINYNP